MKPIKYSSKTYVQFNAHLERAYPFEGCGFLFGKEKYGYRYITDFLAVENVYKGDRRKKFQIAEFDYLKAEKYAETTDQLLLGICHSHPNHPAIPSKHDLKQAVPYFSYVISSVENGKAMKTTSWQLNQETKKFEQEEQSFI